jgi:hypothetical protein
MRTSRHRASSVTPPIASGSVCERSTASRAGYTIVKDVVLELKVGRQEVFLPLSHPPGEARVDFGFADVVVGGVTTQVAVFVLSLPYSDAVYC